jgi:hypothetical protein
MPVRFNYQSGEYEVSCNTCGTSVPTRTPNARDEVVHQTIRWRTFRPRPGQTREGYYPQCRACEREAAAARRANRAARQPRVPGTPRQARGLDRTYGVELEFVAPTDRYTITNRLEAAGLGRWKVKSDVSVSGGRGLSGWEVVSPVLRGEDGLEQIRKVTRLLRDLGATVNRTCGMHVHHGADDLTIGDVKRVTKTWYENQSLIDGLVSPSRRGSANRYCRALDGRFLREVEAVESLQGLQRVYFDRYRSLNLASYGRHGTLEIRQHQGTLDAEKVVSWVRFGQAIIDGAVVAAPETTVPRPSTIRGLLDALGSTLDATARTFLIGRAVEFGAVAV